MRYGTAAAHGGRGGAAGRLPEGRADQASAAHAIPQREVSTVRSAGRVTLPGRENFTSHPRVVPSTRRPLSDGHVAEPGLAVVDVAATDNETAFGHDSSGVLLSCSGAQKGLQGAADDVLCEVG